MPASLLAALPVTLSTTLSTTFAAARPVWNASRLVSAWHPSAVGLAAAVARLPMLLTVFVAWMRQDRVDAERIGAELDAASEDVAVANADDGLWWITQPRDRGVR